MLPAGASLVHPHFQMFGGPAVPWLLQLMWQRAEEFHAEHGVPEVPQELVDEETERNGERFIAAKAGCTWLAPFAPTGGREVIAGLPGFGRIAELGGEQVAALAAVLDGARLVRA